MLSLTFLHFSPFSAFMLSTQLNYLIEEKTLSLYCICVLKRHVTNILKDGRYGGFLGEIWVIIDIMPTENHSLWYFDRRVVIILEIDVIKRAEEVAGRIGDPTPYTESKTLF